MRDSVDKPGMTASSRTQIHLLGTQGRRPRRPISTLCFLERRSLTDLRAQLGGRSRVSSGVQTLVT